MLTTSASLLERLRLPNEEAAWTRFVDLYTPLLFYWSRRVGLQEEDAADVVQEVFVILLEKLPEFTYDRRRSFRGWLHTVLLNKWRDRKRRQSVLPVVVGNDLLTDVPEAGDQDAFVEQDYHRYLVARAVQLMQQDFEPTTWKACWEHVVSGRPAADVAKELGVREGTVYSAKCRVLQRLRQELAELWE